ncbi:hypothetical protein RclHR1_08900006 [Rhizophagus clarus]|uniref:BTB/POZ domain-containing protein n=1 Tax=Rhizophagus clarus TaxID=94130 RepID=A0A2Z6SH80_9GLOM|nr:hypothetical protein RclHR1_08900006 [Rhizophagus clarus]GES75778.1 BTB/POZ domain-containing protein [Rhizophagus clarus]
MKYHGILSKEFEDTLKSGEFYDIEILAGKQQDAKKFKLHSLILKIRSPFFRNELSNNTKLKYENNIIKYEKPNISSKIFDILIKYIYSGTFDVHKNDVRTNIALLVASDELRLHNVKNIILHHLFKDQELLKRNFVLIQHIASKYTQFSRLNQFYNSTIRQDPSIIFKTGDFVTIEKDVLLNLIKKNTSFKQIDVWDKLKEWAIAQSQLPSDTTKWTKDNMTTFGNLVQSFIPHIKFKEISPKDFSQKIKPFKRIFDIDFYVQILEYYSSNEESHSKFGINLMNIDSRIINSDHAFILGNFIKIAAEYDRNVVFDFELLVRGSRDGFDLQTFHNHCNEKGPTITVVNVKNTDEILGGFNPLNFESTREYNYCEHSFIFSLNKNKLTNFIFSKVVDKQHAVFDYGIDFGANHSDLRLLKNNTNIGQCYNNSYEKLIRKRAGTFEIDDYEVFLIKTR